MGYDYLHVDIHLLPYFLLALLLISEVSDVCDGYLARKYNQVTDLGKILDPMVDSIYRISVFLAFTLPPVELPVVLVLILLYRDWLVNILRTVCALKGWALAARTSGKLKAIIQAAAAFAVVLLMIPYSSGYLAQEDLYTISLTILSGAALYTVLSGFDYVYANKNQIKLILSEAEARDSLLDQIQSHSASER